MKEKIARWFKQGLWTEEMVRDAVAKAVIKPEDYKEITGKDYTSERGVL